MTQNGVYVVMYCRVYTVWYVYICISYSVDKQQLQVSSLYIKPVWVHMYHIVHIYYMICIHVVGIISIYSIGYI